MTVLHSGSELGHQIILALLFLLALSYPQIVGESGGENVLLLNKNNINKCADFSHSGNSFAWHTVHLYVCKTNGWF